MFLIRPIRDSIQKFEEHGKGMQLHQLVMMTVPLTALSPRHVVRFAVFSIMLKVCIKAIATKRTRSKSTVEALAGNFCQMSFVLRNDLLLFVSGAKFFARHNEITWLTARGTRPGIHVITRFRRTPLFETAETKQVITSTQETKFFACHVLETNSTGD
jgi:hypothetical protein